MRSPTAYLLQGREKIVREAKYIAGVLVKQSLILNNDLWNVKIADPFAGIRTTGPRDEGLGLKDTTKSNQIVFIV